jgi:hypothetical protein
MSEITEPELNRMEVFVRDYLLPLLSSDFRQPGDTDDEKVDAMRSILAKQYVELTDIGPLWKTELILVVYDFGFQLNSVVYGLVLGAIGSFEIALSNFYTPENLAEEVFEKPDNIRSEIITKAERTVRTNVGLAGLMCGFLLQVFAVSGPLPTELVGQNYLVGIIPGWVGFFAIFIGVTRLVKNIL